MPNKKLESLINQMENHLECWKQFNNFFGLARTKKFAVEDDNRFLETKSVIIQDLELILSSLDVFSPTKDEIHSLIGNAPSLRSLSDMNEGALRNLESQWHKIYIGWHSILGQLKVKQREEESRSAFGALFGKRRE
jgi:hypothetical protein